MSELSDVDDGKLSKEEEMKEKLLDMSLDEIVDSGILQSDKPEHLRWSYEKPKPRDGFGPNADDNELDDVYGRGHRDRDPNAIPAPILDLSDRSHRHFEHWNGKIFVRNLPYAVTDDDLHTLFSPYGRLIRAALNYDDNGRSRGTAYVVYERRDDAMKAFNQLDRHFLDGRKMVLRMVAFTSGCGDVTESHIYKRRGDRRQIDNVECFQDNEVITVDHLDMELDEYIRHRKRARTWNYY